MLIYSVNFHFYIEEPAQVLRNHWKSTELLTSEGMPKTLTDHEPDLSKVRDQLMQDWQYTDNAVLAP